MTGDIIDDFLPSATNVWWCPGWAGAVWADVDGDGTHDTQAVFETLTGQAGVFPEFTTGKWYFFNFGNNHCGGPGLTNDRGRFRVYFVDILAPGFVWNDPTTWTHKSIKGLTVRAYNDGTWDTNDPRFDDPNVLPYQLVQAYRQLGQVDPATNLFGHDPADHIPPLAILQVTSGRKEYQFSDPAGIMELYVTTDFAENDLDDLILYDQELPDPPTQHPGLALVFDTSGSMGWSHEGTVGVPVNEQRITLAKDAALPILQMLNDFNSGAAGFGVSRFPGQIFTGCNGEIVFPMTVVDQNSIDTATPLITGLNPTGSTPLLSGLSTALSMFTDQSPRAIVLLSDGYHNCPSLVDVTDPEVQTVIGQASAYAVKIYTIGFGRPSDVDHPLLEALASQTGAEFYDVTMPQFDPATWDPATGLQDAYKAILANALGLQTAIDPLGVIQTGEKVTREVLISPLDHTVSFYLSWATRRPDRLELRVRSSDGIEVPSSGAGIQIHEGETYKMLTVQRDFLSLADKVGDAPWTVEIEPKALEDNTSEHYQYSVLMNSDLKMEVEFDAKYYRTGDIITVTSKITEEGKPVTGLKNVQITGIGPEDGLGNWFAKNKVSTEELAKVSEVIDSERLSPLLRKFRLLRDIRKVAIPGKAAPVTVALHDDGTDGDATANDGIYTAEFPNTTKEGTYTFRITASRDAKQGRPFERDVRVDKYVRVKVAPETIEFDVSKVPSTVVGVTRLQVILTPKDTLGNFLGPRYASAIKVNTSWGRLIGTPEDNLDGTYTQIIEIPEELREIDISASVKTVSSASRRVSISQLAGRPKGLFGFLAWLLRRIALFLER